MMKTTEKVPVCWSQLWM